MLGVRREPFDDDILDELTIEASVFQVDVPAPVLYLSVAGIDEVEGRLVPVLLGGSHRSRQLRHSLGFTSRRDSGSSSTTQGSVSCCTEGEDGDDRATTTCCITLGAEAAARVPQRGARVQAPDGTEIEVVDASPRVVRVARLWPASSLASRAPAHPPPPP